MDKKGKHKEKLEDRTLELFKIIERQLCKIANFLENDWEKKNEKKSWWKKHNKVLLDRILLTIILSALTFFLTERLRSPQKELNYRIEAISTLKDVASMEVTVKNKPDNSYLYNEDISFDLRFNTGLPNKIFFIYEDYDMDQFTSDSFEKATFKSPTNFDSIVSSIMSVKVKVKGTIDFIDREEEMIKPIYIATLDLNNSIHIDVVLLKLKSKLKLDIGDGSSGIVNSTLTDNAFPLRDFSKDEFRLIKGDNVLEMPTTLNGFLEIDSGDHSSKFNNVLTKNGFAEDRAQILEIIKKYYAI